VIVPTNSYIEPNTIVKIKNASVIAFWVCYSVYILNSFSSGTARYLCNIYTVESAHDYVKRIKLVSPSIWFSIECYHMETIVTKRTWRDSTGTLHTETDRETRKVVTYNGSEYFHFTEWQDISGEFGLIEAFNLTKVTFDKAYYFGDNNTSQQFKTQRNDFIEANRHRDVNYNVNDHFQIDGYQDRLLSLYDTSKRPFWLNLGWYLLLSLLGFSWFYRVWMERACVKTSFTFKKRVTVE